MEESSPQSLLLAVSSSGHPFDGVSEHTSESASLLPDLPDVARVEPLQVPYLDVKEVVGLPLPRLVDPVLELVLQESFRQIALPFVLHTYRFAVAFAGVRAVRNRQVPRFRRKRLGTVPTELGLGGQGPEVGEAWPERPDIGAPRSLAEQI